MPYRPPRPGDLLAARVGGDEHHAVIRSVADTGRVLTLSGWLGEHRLDVVIRRVGITALEENAAMANWFSEKIDEIKAEIAKLRGHADPVVKAVVAEVESKASQLKTAAETDAEALGKEAAADASQVGHAGVSALKPVAQQAEGDAKRLAGEAETDVKNATK